MLLFRFPDGQVANASQLAYYTPTITGGSGLVDTLSWAFSGAPATVFSYLGFASNSQTWDPINIYAMIAQMDAAIASGLTGTIDINPISSAFITNVIPSTGINHAGSPVLDVFGTGFYPNMVNGLIWIEDAHLIDSNSMSFTVAYDTPSHLIATWASNGDNVANSGVNILYFQDAGMLVTNYLTRIVTV